MNANHGLTDETVARIHEAFAHCPGVEQVLLYGSRAKGKFKPGSDVDLKLVGAGVTSKILGQIQSELEDGPLPLRFDVSIPAQITQADLLDHITKEQAFLEFVLSHYVSVGVEELDQNKLTPLLRPRYNNSIADAVADPGEPNAIGKVFAGFQKYLYAP